MGASLRATIPYEAGAEGTATFCLNPGTESFEKEVHTVLYEEWPGSYIELYAWYQTIEILWCRLRWGISYVSLSHCVYYNSLILHYL